MSNYSSIYELELNFYWNIEIRTWMRLPYTDIKVTIWRNNHPRQNTVVWNDDSSIFKINVGFQISTSRRDPHPMRSKQQKSSGVWWSSVRRCSILSQWWSYQIVFELSEATYRHSWLTVWTNPGGGMYPISLVARLVRTAENNNDIATRAWRHAKNWPAKEETQLKAR